MSNPPTCCGRKMRQDSNTRQWVCTRCGAWTSGLGIVSAESTCPRCGESNEPPACKRCGGPVG
ncbi:hypothetical protein ACFXO2_41180 [Streptomyces sp. NPDC059152]|uniref:hypothetical protein n=1 Tax=Streptomyces sp. NPDC059152 TaxID=3346742 RepID=UPI0036B02818